MNTLFEILKIVLPAITAGLFTFFITKYTYNKNRPLDKLEIAYNKIYYPLYRIISDKNINEDINIVISKSKIYFTKYNKYVDISTKRLYESLCQCTKEAKKKSIYTNLKTNIYDRNSYLRRRLGYLEPNIVQSYKYAMPIEKSLLRISIGLCMVYISIIAYSICMNNFDTISIIFVAIFTISLLWIICEILWCFLRFLYYKIRK